MKKKAPKYILDIVPLTRIPLSRNQSFSYLHEKKLPAGTLVSIPLFKRKVEGIVLKSRNDFHRLGNFELKKVSEVLEEKFLTPKQLELAHFVSDYYFSSLGIVLKFFVQKRVKPRKANPDLELTEKFTPTELTQEQKSAVKKISEDKKKSKFLLFGPSGSGKTEVYIHSILKIRGKNPRSQALILLPELILTPQAIERYGRYFPPEEIVVLTSQISKGQLYESWQKIKSGQAKIIIGTRMALFAPFKNLELIVIDEEQDMSFKQWDMNPRYDARTIGQQLSEICACSLVLGSSTPRVETFWKAQKKKLKFIILPPLQVPGLKNGKLSLELVDMRKEKWKSFSGKIANTSPLSRKLQSEIAYALKNRQKIILFVNRQGMSSFSVCENCKEVLRCPHCDRALVYEKQGFYKCLHCHFETDALPQCQKCQGISFKNIGLGTQKVEQEIKDLFPNAKTLRADNQTTQKKNSQEKIYQEFKYGESDILIGTQMITKGWDLHQVALIGIIDADNLLSIPDLYTNEKAFQNILQVAGRSGRIGARFPGLVLVQTYHPENQILRWITEKNYSAFFENEIKEREPLRLPPFGRIIKLIFQDYSLKKVETETKIIFEKLNDSISRKDISVTPPHLPLIAKIRSRNRLQIIIKFSSNLPDEIEKIIRQLPSGWIIDIDPITLI